MNLKKKLLGSLVTIVAIMMLYSVAVFAGETEASGEGSGTIEITSVTYDGSALLTSQEFYTITEIQYTTDGGTTTNTIDVDTDSEIMILTVDNVQQDIEEGASYDYDSSYEFTSVAKSDDVNAASYDTCPGCWLNGQLTDDSGTLSMDYYVVAAAFISGNELLEDYSVLDAIVSGTVTATGATDVVFDSEGSFFNGLYLSDTTDYEISNLDMTLDGLGANDFSGWGAGVALVGESSATVDDSVIDTTGSNRTAIYVGGTSTIDVTDTVITATGSDEDDDAFTALYCPMLKTVPWALGLEGNVRATNVLDAATATYTDCVVVSTEWGALSTDSCTVTGTTGLDVEDVLSGIGTVEVITAAMSDDYIDSFDAVKTITDDEGNSVTYGFTMEGSGYVTYADSGVYNYYTDVTFFAEDYAIILAAGEASAWFDGEDTTIVTDRIGAMWHKNTGGTLSLEDGSWTVGDIAFLAKSSSDNVCYPNLEVDGTDIDITGTDDYSGVLYQLMESDDAGGILVTEYTVPEQEDDWSTVEEIEDETTAAEASFTDVDVDGDIYNSVYTVNEDLDVTLTTSSITGVISSSNANHVDEDGNVIAGGTTISADTDEDAYLYAGRIVNTASEAVNNDVNLTLVDTDWTITGTSYLSTLTIDSDSQILTESGYTVTMTVDGVATDIEAGTYTGDIVLTVSADTASDDTDTDTTDDTDTDTTDDTDTDTTDDTDTDTSDDTDTDTTDDTDTDTSDDTDTDTSDDTDTDTSDDTDEVTITSDDATVTGDIPENSIFTYEALSTDSDEYTEIAEILAGDDYDNIGTFVVYDLDLTSDGVTVELSDDGVVVTMPVPDALADATDIIVYVLEEDGTLTELDCTVEDGYITFTAPHFSTYVFAEDTSSDSDTATSTVSTGDSSNVILWISVSSCALLAAAGVSYYTNRKRSIQ